MASIGYGLMICGIVSLVLNLINMELKILMWVDHWGPETGWMIRIGMIVLGAVIAVIFPGQEASDGEAG
ncbi:hypothetical protein DB346_18320 [Verrucomicrobia bacterium LW23]|nr:hypothetical protein DB346_18320 [Verrucomicrobia bacterium LW23]